IARQAPGKDGHFIDVPLCPGRRDRSALTANPRLRQNCSSKNIRWTDRSRRARENKAERRENAELAEWGHVTNGKPRSLGHEHTQGRVVECGCAVELWRRASCVA